MKKPRGACMRGETSLLKKQNKFYVLLADCNPCEILTIALLCKQRVVRAPMSFFDITPNGIITNWFSVDMQQVDNLTIKSMAHIVVEILAHDCYCNVP